MMKLRKSFSKANTAPSETMKAMNIDSLMSNIYETFSPKGDITMKKLLTLTLTLLTLFVFICPGLAQEGRQAQDSQLQSQAQIACPAPFQFTKTESTTATPYASDFPAATAPLANFGGTAINQHFRHTFKWNSPGDCCQYISGTLTIKYKALQKGTPPPSSDAGNDSVGIYSNGSVLTSKHLYTPPIPAGFTGSTSITLTPAMLANNRLSFLVQDDTSVLSATLTVVGCCVKK
jgi:hypothetical protein